MFAGDKLNMPLNKPGAPKIGLFPNSACHNPRVSTYTYRVPLVQLPPCASPGFVVASHCVVRNPCGKTETAWAEGDYTFSDKGWGWYDDYYYNQQENQYTILYGTACNNDSLRLYHLDITNNTTELMLVEYVGNSPGNYDGAAFDISSGMFFFTNYDTKELWVNLLTGEEPSFCAGVLEGTSASGTFYDGDYYYVDEDVNTINSVTFTADWLIAGETTLDTIPAQVTVNDIAMSPAGDYLHLLAQHNGSNNELISWKVSDQTFYSHSLALGYGAQIAYGSDGLLYALAPLSDIGDSTLVVTIDFFSDSLTVVADEVIFIDDPFSDLSGGPGQ